MIYFKTEKRGNVGVIPQPDRGRKSRNAPYDKYQVATPTDIIFYVELLVLKTKEFFHARTDIGTKYKSRIMSNHHQPAQYVMVVEAVVGVLEKL